jgi:hypothetical protein
MVHEHNNAQCVTNNFCDDEIETLNNQEEGEIIKALINSR